MATKCKKCGERESRFPSDLCAQCSDELCAPRELRPDGLNPNPEPMSGPPQQVAAPSNHAPWQGSAALCILLGLACLAIGTYLLIDPTVTVPDYAGIGTDKVTNIHMMTLGGTLSIVGAIFLAAGIRPR